MKRKASPAQLEARKKFKEIHSVKGREKLALKKAKKESKKKP